MLLPRASIDLSRLDRAGSLSVVVPVCLRFVFLSTQTKHHHTTLLQLLARRPCAVLAARVPFGDTIKNPSIHTIPSFPSLDACGKECWQSCRPQVHLGACIESDSPFAAPLRWTRPRRSQPVIQLSAPIRLHWPQASDRPAYHHLDR